MSSEGRDERTTGRSWPRRFLNRLEVDQAVFFAVAARAWQFIAGPVTLVLIGTYFSPALQGYFYTFASLLALQSFVELGLHVAIINVTSHEWSKLNLDDQGRVVGDSKALSRLVSLGHLIAKWYAVASVLFVVMAGTAGTIFFSLKPTDDVDWFNPWLAVVMIYGVLLWTLPFAAILEGCNQLRIVNRYRLVQAVTGNLVVWLCIPLGLELWTAVASAVVRLFWEIYLLAVHYRKFFTPFLSSLPGPSIQWRTEVWPLQWRLGIQGIFSYFSLWMYTPVMFQSHSPEVAGQMGMTWGVLTSIQMAAFAWVHARVPLFGVLVAKQEFEELDRVFKRVSGLALLVMLAASTGFWLAVYGLYALQHPLAQRVLPPLDLFIFAAALMLQLITQCLSSYVRAHKQEPLVAGGVITSLTIAILVIVLGSRYGTLGAGIGLFLPVLLIALPYRSYVWQRCRQERAEHAPLVVADRDLTSQ